VLNPFQVDSLYNALTVSIHNERNIEDEDDFNRDYLESLYKLRDRLIRPRNSRFNMVLSQVQVESLYNGLTCAIDYETESDDTDFAYLNTISMIKIRLTK